MGKTPGDVSLKRTYEWHTQKMRNSSNPQGHETTTYRPGQLKKKKTTTPNTGKNVEKLVLVCTAGGRMGNGTVTLEKG